jgi:uncharacterized protein YabE (DUF348 family)
MVKNKLDQEREKLNRMDLDDPRIVEQSQIVDRLLLMEMKKQKPEGDELQTILFQKRLRKILQPLKISFIIPGQTFLRAAEYLYKRRLVTGLLLATLITTGALYQFAANTVTIYIDGEAVQTVRTYHRTVAELLQEINISLHPRDRVTPSGSMLLSPRTHIIIDKAFPVFVVADNIIAEIWTPVIAVSVFLEEEGYHLGSYDRIEPEGIEQLFSMARLQIIRVEKVYETEKIALPYEDLTRGNPALDRGFSQVVSEGRAGLKEELAEITYEDGEEVSRVVIQSFILKSPLNRVVEYGENIRLERNGHVMEFTKAMIVSATAYCPGTPESGCPLTAMGHAFCTGPYNDGYTYTGMKCRQGLGTLESPRMIAVDPRVIPLHSMLYIEGYGFARAEDIGGAIKGNKIDILFDKHSDVARFGVKHGIKVYLLSTY